LSRIKDGRGAVPHAGRHTRNPTAALPMHATATIAAPPAPARDAALACAALDP